MDKDAKIQTLDPSKLQTDSLKTSVLPQTKLELNDAIKNAIDKAELAPPAGNGPMLEWTVANGRLIHGFQIFRSNNEVGPFLLINKAIVPASIEDEAPKSFQYRDNTARTGQTYWYYIGVIYNDGHKQQLSGPQKVVAK